MSFHKLVLTALRAGLAGRLWWFLLYLLRQLTDRLARRICVVIRATHKRTERPLPQHHLLTAVVAELLLLLLVCAICSQVRLGRVVLPRVVAAERLDDDLFSTLPSDLQCSRELRGLLHLNRTRLGIVHHATNRHRSTELRLDLLLYSLRVLLPRRDRNRHRLIFREVRTRIERSELTPAQHQRRSALLAGLIGRLLPALDLFHIRAGNIELFFKVPIEALQQICPLLLTLFHVIQFTLQLCRVIELEDVWEVLHQQLRHHHTDLSRDELSLHLLDIVPLLDR